LSYGRAKRTYVKPILSLRPSLRLSADRLARD